MIPPALPPITPPAPPTPPASGSGTIAPAATPDAGQGSADNGSFWGQVQGALQQMEQLQSNAASAVTQVAGGTSGDVHTAVIAVEKADLAFGMMLQLRNKAVEAYSDISHMAF